MASLADSFLADLEDIEGEPLATSTSIKGESSEMIEETILPEFSSILNDDSFRDFMTSVSRPISAKRSLARSDEEFFLIEKSNTITPLIDSEIYSIHKYVYDW